MRTKAWHGFLVRQACPARLGLLSLVLGSPEENLPSAVRVISLYIQTRTCKDKSWKRIGAGHQAGFFRALRGHYFRLRFCFDDAPLPSSSGSKRALHGLHIIAWTLRQHAPRSENDVPLISLIIHGPRLQILREELLVAPTGSICFSPL